MAFAIDDQPESKFSAGDARLEASPELVLLETPLERAVTSRHGPVRDSIQRRMLAVCDVIAVTASMWLTDTFIVDGLAQRWAYLAALLVVPIAKIAGMYDRDTVLLRKTTLDEVPRIATLAGALSVLVFALHDITSPPGSYAGTAGLVIVCLLTTLSLSVGRAAARALTRQLRLSERLLVFGSESDTERLSGRVSGSPEIDAVVVGRVPIAYGELPGGRSRVLGSSKELSKIIAEHLIDRVVILPGERHSDEVADVIRTVRSLPVKLSVMPSAIDAIGSVTRTDDIAGMQLLAICDAEMTRSSRLAKRAMDLIGALLALLLAAPVFAIVAIAIKLDSRGPVFFKQDRIGRDGKRFKIIKFRSMRVGADDEKSQLAHLSITDDLFKVKDDPRVTRVGRLLRKTSLDELPQLVNVLSGDMSLVGPRPLIPEEDSAITGWYRRRSHITPGITGIWQLLGSVRIPLHEMVKLDYLYVANWSIWSDMKILLRTIPHVLSRRGL